VQSLQDSLILMKLCYWLSAKDFSSVLCGGRMQGLVQWTRAVGRTNGEEMGFSGQCLDRHKLADRIFRVWSVCVNRMHSPSNSFLYIHCYNIVA